MHACVYAYMCAYMCAYIFHLCNHVRVNGLCLRVPPPPHTHTVPTRKLTNADKVKIGQELNEFKLYEMKIHSKSKENLHFIKLPSSAQR